MKKHPGLWLQSLLYAAAGINHFWHPAFYYRFIPPYLPNHPLINTVSGVAEIALAIMLLVKRTRKAAAYAIMLLLVLFIPAHIYLMEISRCLEPGFCMPWFAALIRLFPGQLLLIAWAYAQLNV